MSEPVSDDLPNRNPAPVPAARARVPLGFFGVIEFIFVLAGYVCAAGNLLILLVTDLEAFWILLLVVAVFAAGVWLARRGRDAVRAALVPLVLLVLMGWGLLLNHSAIDRCALSHCGLSTNVLRPLAEPHVVGLVALHLATVLAYAVSRRRPEALHPHVEVIVHAALLVGVALQVLVAVQFTSLMQYVIYLPITFPVIAPPLATWIFARELTLRLRRRGAEATLSETSKGPTTVYRAPPPRLRMGKGVHFPTLARALGVASILVGLHAVVQAAWLGRAGAAMEVFTATCGHTLSKIPFELIEGDCHYLCTVAAQGHPWLVRPERLGKRNGRIVLVNRQLAVANAFEDLLHERWPRFGAWARRTYDRVGLPVSRWIRRRWLADAIYLAMKPAEWCFLLALLLLNPRSPEARIARMYRL